VAEILHDPDGAAARVRDHAAEMLAEGKPPMDEARRAWSRWASDDRLDAAAGVAEDDPADGTSFVDQLALARQMLPLIYGDAGT